MEGEYKHSSIQKVQNKEYLIKNACYSVTKYYLCKRNNKRSLLGRKQRSQVARSFPNRYQFSCINKVTSLFSTRYILIIILQCKTAVFASYLDHIDVEIVYKIRRKALVLLCKQAVFVAQYYPIRAQWLAFQWLKVAHKKSENLQKLLL